MKVLIDRAVVKQAISAFEQVTAHPNSFWDCTGDAEALRAALATAELPAQRAREKLIAEYRSSMPLDVMHLWAKDVIAILSTAPTQAQPLTDEQDRALCEAYCNDASDEYFKARPALDFPEMRRIFYAGHRKAWITKAQP
jgi:hypothetical protein